MEAKSAKIFVSHYPFDLALYKTIAKMAKAQNPAVTIILFKVGHPYYASFDFSPYQRYFDSVVEFPFIAYQKNIIRGIRDIKKFKTILQNSLQNLKEFDHIDVYIEHSAWLPVNVIFFALVKISLVAHIYRWTLGRYEIPGTRVDRVRTWFCLLYHLIIPAYPIKAMKRNNGRFVTFLYTIKPPGTLVRFINPHNTSEPSARKSEIIIPYPLLVNPHKNKPSKEMVVIFGDSGIFDLKEYIGDPQPRKTLRSFFTALEKHYKGMGLYYKPHPGDITKDFPSLMAGISRERYQFLPARVNAQVLIEEYWPRIKAVYTFFSTSVAWSSFFGIPSYTLYRLIYNEQGIKRLDETFGQPDIASDLIFPISHSRDIGCIDGKKIPPRIINLKHIPPIYQSILS